MKILVGSPIRQEPGVLEEFLTSLMELNTSGLTVDYVFVDGNDNPASKELLRTFAPAGTVEILPGQATVVNYARTEVTPRWQEELIWRVAAAKDDMLRLARERGYEGILLVDSDLVMHPKTLSSLLAANVDIISEIFWTKWQPEAQELPQVWVSGHCTLHKQGRNEVLPPQEVQRREEQFLAMLRRPGVYEVGGLGALTLIRRAAIEAGASFAEIPTLEYQGENRHFCVRAQALGLKLHVDTHYPALHLHRQEDLGRVAEFKRIYAGRQCKSGESAVQAAMEAAPQAGWPDTVRGAAKQPDIVLLSSIDWTYLWQRPQHLAQHFAALGSRVVYVDGSLMRVDVHSDPGTGELPALMRQVMAQVSRLEGPVAVSGAITQMTFASQKTIDSLDLWLDALKAHFGLDGPVVFWVMGWQWGNEVSRLKRHGFVVYDCLDDLAGFTWATPDLIQQEESLIAQADLVFAVTPRLAEKTGERHSAVYLIPNGVNPESFAVCEESRQRRLAQAHVVGYLGVLADWLDTRLIADVARAHPAWHFLLVGSVEGADVAPLRGLPNVELTGRIAYSKVPDVLATFDVGIVPFRQDRPLLDSADAIKIYEYIAAGLPVVSTPFGQIRQGNDLIYVAKDAAEFGQALERALHTNSPALSAARRTFTEGNSWRLRALLALGLVNAYLLQREQKGDLVPGRLVEALAAWAASESAQAELYGAYYSLVGGHTLPPELEATPLLGQEVVQKLVDRRNWTAARALCESLLQRFPADVEHQYNLAAVELAVGDHASALQHLLGVVGRLEAVSPIPEIIYALQQLGQPDLGKAWEQILLRADAREADDETAVAATRDLIQQTRGFVTRLNG